MGLGVTLNNALSGMRTSTASLDVLARNVANAGTPGYHRQSLSTIDTQGVNSTYARSGGIDRAFNQSLQSYYTRSVSEAGYSNVRADVLDRLQVYLGKPGDPGSLDTAYSEFYNSIQQLGTSPESYAARATVISQAQQMVSTLNGLTSQIQGLRQETEVKIAADVDVLNQSITALTKINARLADQTGDLASRAALMDQRDRLVSQISELADLRVDYRSDDTVALSTRSGVGILDNKASILEFQGAGAIGAAQQFNVDAAKNGVGTLLLHTPSGLSIDLVKENVLRGGEIAGLIDLRDKTLVTAQSQIDTIAASLAQALSTNSISGTAATSGAAQGFSVDIASIRDGNDVLVNYTENGVAKSLRVTRVDDATKLPLDYMDSNGTRVLGLDFSGGAAAVAGALGTALGAGFAVSNPSGSQLQILDDGAANTTSIASLSARSTASGLQSGLGLNLFVDSGNADFTNSLSGNGQIRGFAGRISLNSAVVADNKLLVQYQAGGSLGDAARANHLAEGLQGMKFATTQAGPGVAGAFRLGGSISDIIAQTIDHVGGMAASALSDRDTQQLTMETLNQRMDSEYGVNVDEEMARLMELQNAYAANARVISVVQELLDRLMQL